MSDPGHLPRLEEMVAVLSDSKVKETLDEIVSDKNLPVIENGSPGESVKSDCSSHNADSTKTKRTPVSNGACDKSKDQDKGGLSNGLADSEDKNADIVKSESDLSSEKDIKAVTPLKKVTKTHCGKVNAKSNGRNGIKKQESIDSTNSTSDLDNSPFKPPLSKQSKPQNPDQTKEPTMCTEEVVKVKEESTGESLPETKCQSEAVTLSKHSPVSDPGKDVASTSSQKADHDKHAPKTPPTCDEDLMTTPKSKRKSPDDSGSSTGNDSLPLKKRRGRPPGSRNKEGDEEKPKRKYSKKKKLVMDGGEKEDQSKDKSKDKQVKTTTPVKVKSEASVPVHVVRGPVLRVQGANIESVVSSKLINVPDAEEEVVKGGKKKQKVVKHAKRQNNLVAGHVGQAAVLSSECPSPTGLWVCTLCGNPPNFGILGDLYGPYYPPGCDVPCSSKRDSMSKNDRHRGSDPRESRCSSSKGGRQVAGTSRKGSVQDSRSQRGKSLMAKQADLSKTRKWRQIKTYMEDMSLMTGRKSSKRRKSESESDYVELWVHEECAVWSQGVIFLQGTLYGIHDAAKEAENKV